MSTVRILKEHALNNVESLVIVGIDNNNTLQECIAIVDHSNGNLKFRAAEIVTAVNKDLVWMRRTMFNGRSADQLINENKSINLNSMKLTLEKTTSPVL